MKITQLVVSIVFLLCCPKHKVTSSRILLFTAFPHHHELFLEMALLLRSNGHVPEFLSYQLNVTSLQQYQFPIQFVNYSLDLSFDNISFNIVNQPYNFEIEFFYFKPFLNLLIQWCHHLLNNEILHGFLKSQNYSLLILDLYANDVCPLALAQKLDVPVIGFWPSAINLPCSYYLGIPSFPSFIPTSGKTYEQPMSLSERISNILALKVELQEWIYNFYNPLSQILEQYVFPKSSITELYSTISVVFTNEDPVIDTIRPMLPSVIPIGGFHCQLPTSLPKPMEDFINGFKGGGIVFVQIKIGIFPKTSIMELVSLLNIVFSSFPLTGFIWNEVHHDLHNKTSNIISMEQVHDHDVLGLPKTRLFIGTCDKSSVMSSLFHAIPVLCIPISTEQWDTARRLVSLNASIILNKRTLSIEKLKSTIHNMLMDRRFSDAAHRVSTLIRDKPESPSDLFIYWTNYIIRHKFIPHLKSSSQQLSILQYYNADIALLIFVTSMLILVVLSSLIYLFIGLKKLTPKDKRTKSE